MRRRLASRFSLPKTRIGRDGGVVRPGRPGPTLRVLSRGLVHFRAFDFSDVPAGERASALEPRLEQTSPYAQWNAWIVWRGTAVAAWLWDAGTAAPPRSVCPESLLQAPPATGGCRLVACMDGYEGQYWDDTGFPARTHWWPEPPKLLEWQRFQRSAGIRPDGRVPQPETPASLAWPWGWHRPLRRAAGGRHERWALAAIGAFLVILLANAGAGLWNVEQRQAEIRARTDRLEREAAPVLDARERARADRRRAEALLDAMRHPSQAEVMAEVATILEQQNAGTLAAWRYSDGRLEFSVADPTGAPSQLVAALESAGGFRSVSVQSGNDPSRLTLRMNVIAGG